MTKKFICVLPLLWAMGCKQDSDEATASPKAETPAAVTSAPVLDSKIASAVANAAKRQTGASVGNESGPPEDGILGAVRANAEVAKGAVPKLKLGSAGSEPRIVLGASEWGDKRMGQLELSVRTGASMLPTTVFRLEVQEPAAVTPAAPETNPQLGRVLGVVSAELGSTQPGEVPPQLSAEIRKLKGSQYNAQVSPNGLLGTPGFTLSKGANPQLDTLMQAGAAALNDAAPALPHEPVGVGAFWMVTSRETLLGTDVVAYRMFKVTEINGDQAVLDVNTKRYLADGPLGLSGLESSKVHQFQADSSTQMTVSKGSALPLDGRTQTSVRSLVELEGAPRPVQVEMRSLFTFTPRTGRGQ